MKKPYVIVGDYGASRKSTKILYYKFVNGKWKSITATALTDAHIHSVFKYALKSKTKAKKPNLWTEVLKMKQFTMDEKKAIYRQRKDRVEYTLETLLELKEKGLLK
jgi:hypothetical protein